MERCNKKYNFRNALLTLLAVMSYASTANAAGPMWTYELLTANNVDVPRGSVGLVRYLITNQSQRPMTLVLEPTQGLSQVGPCILTPTGQPESQCTFSISINGSELPESGIHDGPKICQIDFDGTPNPNQCYQPERQDILDIISSGDPCPGITAEYGLGSYNFNLAGTFVFGVPPLGPGDYQIDIGSTKCERVIRDLVVYPAFGRFTPIDFAFTFNADGTITYPSTSLGVGCGSTIFIKPSPTSSSYNAASDASFDINVLIDETGCGGIEAPGVMELRKN